MRTVVVVMAYMVIVYCAGVLVYGAAVTHGPFPVACTIALGWLAFHTLRVVEDGNATLPRTKRHGG